MKNNCILIVRPENRLIEDVEMCIRLGWHGIPFSPLTIQPIRQNLSDFKEQLLSADAVFWVSPTAVEVAVYLGMNGRLLNCPNIAVGQATARVLQHFSVNNILVNTIGNDSEAALALPIWNHLPKGAKVLIVRGVGGRDYLAHCLQQRGLTVCFSEIYQRVPQDLDWQLLRRFQPKAVWLTSVQLAKLFVQQIPPSLVQSVYSLLYFTHHQRIATALKALGLSKVYCVDNIQQAINQLNNEY